MSGVHTHGAWCHISAEGCPDLMQAPKTLDAAGEGEATQRRRVSPPHATALFWALWLLLLTGFVLWMQLT